MKQPKTPFATHLSGSAKETELRVWSIFQWEKKCPPKSLIVLVILLLIGCGSLVSCGNSSPIQYISACDSAPAEEFLEDKLVVSSGGISDTIELQIHCKFEKENGNRILITVENQRDTDEHLVLRNVFDQEIPSGELRCVELELSESTDTIFYIQSLEFDKVDLSYSVVQYWV